MFFIIFDNLFVSSRLAYFLLCITIGGQYAKNTLSAFSGYPFDFSCSVFCVYKEDSEIKEKDIEELGLEENDEESEDEFDEIASQLQGMKVVLENMETNYDSRLKNIQETYNTRLEEVQQKIAITPHFERPKLYVDHTSKRFPSGSNRKNARPPHGWSLILPTFIPLSNKHCHVSSARST